MTASPEGDVALPLIGIGTRMQRLRDDVRSALLAHRLPEVQDLAETLEGIDETRAIHVVFVGQHDAGKSLLARCLTGNPDIEVGAGPLTDSSTTYEWAGHLLVDTPGVEAGVREEHDAIAAQALQSADVVLFVMTVEGFDDVTTKYFAHVVDSLRTTETLVVVVNKASSEAHERSLAEADIRKQLDSVTANVPVLWTDALDWDEAALSSDPPLARAESGVEELADTVTSLLTTSAAWLRLLTPVRQWRSKIDEGLDLILADIDAENSLAELDLALTQLDAQECEMVEDIKRRAEEARSRLEKRLVELGPTTSHEQAVKASAEVIEQYDQGLGQNVGDETRLPAPAVHPTPSGDLAHAGEDLLKEALRKAAAIFSESRPGGRGHTTVETIGHAFNHKFRPWGIVKTSKWLGRGVVAAGVAIELGEFVDEAKRAKEIERQTSEWSERVTNFAREAAARLEREGISSLTAQTELARGDLHRQKMRMLTQLDRLGQAERKLAQLGQECDSLMHELSQLTAATD